MSIVVEKTLRDKSLSRPQSRVRFFVVLCVVFFYGFSVVATFLCVAVFIKPPLVVSCYCFECQGLLLLNKLFP